MPAKVISQTKDRAGNSFLLQDNGSWWSIKSALPIAEGCFKVVAVGQERYVRGKWRDFIAHEKSQGA